MFTWITFIMPEWYVKIFTAIFAIMLYGYAYGFYSASFRNMRGFKIIIDKKVIILPFIINRKNVQIELEDIIKVEKLDNFEGETIAIHSETNKGFLELEEKWMKKEDFNSLFKLLKFNTQLKFK